MENFWIFFAILSLIVLTLAISIRRGEPPRNNSSRKRDWTPIEKFTLVIAVVSLVNLCTYGYWVYLDQRSYIAVTDTKRLIYEVGKPIRIGIDYINTGKTPAYSISIRQGAIIDKLNANRRAEDVLDPLDKIELGPDIPTQRSYTTYYVTKFSLTDDQKRALEADDPQSTIIYAAQIKYRDIFWIPHTQTSCSAWSREVGAFGVCAWQLE